MPALLVDFRSRGWSGSAETVGPWRAIECYVFGAGWTRGTSQYRGLLTVPEPTQANVQVYDPGRDLDPKNTSGVYYGQIDVGADFRMRFAGRTVFVGRITTLEHKLEPPPGHGLEPVAIASVQALEHMALLSSVMLPGVPYPSGADEPTGTRIARILDLAGAALDAGLYRDIEAGGQLMWDEEPINAGNAPILSWDELVRTMQSELGVVEYTPDGKVRTRNRATVWETNPAATLHLGCEAHAGAIPILAAEFATLQDTVRNEVEASWDSIQPDEIRPRTVDAASRAKYGPRSMVMHNSALYPDETLGNGSARHRDWENYFIARMKDPQRSWRLTLRPRTQAEIDAIEGVSMLTSRVHVLIDDHGPTIDLNLRPVGLEWSLDDTGGAVVVMVLGG